MYRHAQRKLKYSKNNKQYQQATKLHRQKNIYSNKYQDNSKEDYQNYDSSYKESSYGDSSSDDDSQTESNLSGTSVNDSQYDQLSRQNHTFVKSKYQYKKVDAKLEKQVYQRKEESVQGKRIVQKLQSQFNYQSPYQNQINKEELKKLPQIFIPSSYFQQRQSYQLYQTPNQQQILPVQPKNQNKDRILIYNKVFQKQGNGQNINKNPCKHLKCQSLAYLDAYGTVSCQSMCQQFHIIETMFDNFNQVFQRGDFIGQFNFLGNPILMAQLVKDSLEMSNKNEYQKGQFSLQFQHVFVKLLQSRNK